MSNAFTSTVNYFRAGIPVVALSSPSPEEFTTLEKIHTQVSLKLPEALPTFVWDLGAGLRQVKTVKKGSGIILEPTGAGMSDDPMSNPLADILDFIGRGGDEESEGNDFQRGVYVLLDVDQFICGDRSLPDITRRIKNLAFSLKRSARRLILMGSAVKLPDDFGGLVYHIENTLPEIVEVEPAVLACIANMKERFADKAKESGQAFELTVALDDAQQQRLYRSCLGLTIEEILNALRLDMIERMRVDDLTSEVMTKFKTQKLKRLNVEFYDKSNVSPGGYVNFRNYAAALTSAFSSALKPVQTKLKRPMPKGSLLIGPPGTGKTLLAKTIQSMWGVPALKLDMASLYSGLVGSSEENLRTILAIAESLSPCILVIDEIEKGLSGATGNNGDSGTSIRMIGTLLQWMNDKTKPVYVIATANKIDDLMSSYPELFRRGRFDEIFYVGLPNAVERSEIFANHLSRQQTVLPGKLLSELAEQSEYCTGADIEKVIGDAVTLAIGAGRDELLFIDLQIALADNPPTSKGNMGQIAQLQQTAAEKGWKFASALDSSSPKTAKRKRTLETDLNVMV